MTSLAEPGPPIGRSEEEALPESRSGRDDVSILTLQKALADYGIRLHRIHRGTLKATCSGIVTEEDWLFSARCFFAENRLTMNFWDIFRFPTGHERKLREHLVQATDNFPACWQEGRQWLRATVDRPPQWSGIRAGLRGVILPNPGGQFTLELCHVSIRHMLDFTEVNWPQHAE